jgi:alpha-1,6-mannosyltransferase
LLTAPDSHSRRGASLPAGLPLLLLVASAVGSLVAYAVLWLEPLWLGSFDPFAGTAVSIMTILGPTWGGLAWYIPAFALPFSLYVLALVLVPRMDQDEALIVAAAFAVAAPLLLFYTYPALAADPFDYLMAGRIMSEYGLNPYVSVAADFPGDPYLPPVGWLETPLIYGPVWAYLMSATTAVAGDSTASALLLVKALAIVSHLGVAAIIYALARHLRPERATWALVAYAWNPLVIVHFALDGHNDAFMLLTVMAALYVAVLKRSPLALPLLVIGGLVKYVPFVLVPVFLLFLWEQKPRALIAAAAGSGLIVVVAFLPLWEGMATFDGLRDQATRWTSSPTSLLSFVLDDAYLRPLGFAAFGIGYLLVLRFSPGLLEATFAVLVLYLFAISGWTKGWYFSWPLAVGAVIGGAALWMSVAASLGAFVANIFGGWGWMMQWWNWGVRWGRWMMELWLTASMYLPWLAGIAAWLLVLMRRRAAGQIKPAASPGGTRPRAP